MTGDAVPARSIAGAPWLGEKNLQTLLAVLSANGEEARIAGGAVRNALLAEPVTDVDIATTALPDEVERRVAAAGFKPVPTGKAHGTITVVAGGSGYEVTTLRADVETDGRHARVRFGRDWQADALRRDFTINALYARADGTVIDLVGGIADLEARTLRFIGDPGDRVREDYLRILRFFRFFAWYGAGRPDADGLRACARLKGGLAGLSAERIWSELKKLLAAPDPSRALLWMRQASVLTTVLPESEKWGIDAIHGLVAAERDLSWDVDPLLRLAAMVPPDPARMATLAERLRMSNVERDRLIAWAMEPGVDPALADEGLAKRAYRGNAGALLMRVKLSLAAARARAAGGETAAMAEGADRLRQLRALTAWRRPGFPVTGDDLGALGLRQGRRLGEVLKTLEAEWVASGFRVGRDALLERAAKLAAGEGE